jgi:hypothetical protein
VALPFVPSDAAMLALQAGVVAAPRPVARLRIAERLHGPAWALVPAASIVVVIFAIRFVSDTATGLTYLALVAVPPLAAGALGWAARGSRPAAALLVAPLFALAWAARTSLSGQAAGTLLSALSCVTLGVLLAMVAPTGWLKAGIVLMAAADTWLVVSDLLQTPNSTLVTAHPAGGLPQLQSELFGSVSMGYGDLFVAALLGAVLASDATRQRAAALLTLVIAGLFDLLFLAVSELPATVPVALALLVMEAGKRIQLRAARRRPHPTSGPGRPRPAWGRASLRSTSARERSARAAVTTGRHPAGPSAPDGPRPSD